MKKQIPQPQGNLIATMIPQTTDHMVKVNVTISPKNYRFIHEKIKSNKSDISKVVRWALDLAEAYAKDMEIPDGKS